MRFTKDHEWVALEGDVATVGITAYAAEQMGDVVFVELPELGRALKSGGAFAVVESVKAASDVYSPVAGVVVETNAEAVDNPELINAGPEGLGWLARIRLDDPAVVDALMDRAAYETYLGTL